MILLEGQPQPHTPRTRNWRLRNVNTERRINNSIVTGLQSFLCKQCKILYPYTVGLRNGAPPKSQLTQSGSIRFGFSKWGPSVKLSLPYAFWNDFVKLHSPKPLCHFQSAKRAPPINYLPKLVRQIQYRKMKNAFWWKKYQQEKSATKLTEAFWRTPFGGREMSLILMD